MRANKVLSLQKWIKKEFPTKERNGLHSTGHSMGYGFITIEFMNNDSGVGLSFVLIIVLRGKKHLNRLNIGRINLRGMLKGF